MTTRFTTRNTSPAQSRNKVSAGFLSLSLLLPRVGHAAEDPVVAQRGTDRITLSQARAIVASLDADTRAGLGAPNAPTALNGVLRRVLLQRAVLQQAKSQHWEQRPEVAALAQQAHDLTVAQSFLAAQAPVSAGYPADADIAAAYEQNKPRLMQPRSYHLEQLFMAAAQAETAGVRRHLIELGQRITPARGMRGLAGQKGAGAVYADLGWLPENQVAPDIRAAVSGLQEGALSDPVCTAAGCHLLRLIATRPAGPAPLADVREALVRALRQQKQAMAEQAYANTLLAKQPVQINEIQLGQVLVR